MAALDHKPQITMDDGADLVSVLHTKRTPNWQCNRCTEEPPRADSPARHGQGRHAEVPIIAVNDADTKHLFDNRYGTGQSTIDGVIRATNFCSPDRSSWSPATAGADAPGSRARGLGGSHCHEIDPTKALEAVMDGFRVMSMEEAAKIGDVFCTVTATRTCSLGNTSNS